MLRSFPAGIYLVAVVAWVGAPPTVAMPVVLPAPAPAPQPRGALGVFVRGPDEMVAGTPAALRVAAHWASSPTESGPWAGVDVEAWMTGPGRRALLFRGRSDREGLVDARFVAPSWAEG